MVISKIKKDDPGLVKCQNHGFLNMFPSNIVTARDNSLTSLDKWLLVCKNIMKIKDLLNKTDVPQTIFETSNNLCLKEGEVHLPFL